MHKRITLLTTVLLFNATPGLTQQREFTEQDLRFLNRYAELKQELGTDTEDWSALGYPQIQDTLNRTYITLGQYRCDSIELSDYFANSVALDLVDFSHNNEQSFRDSIALMDAAVEVYCPSGSQNWQGARERAFQVFYGN